MASNKAPKQWQLSRNETLNSFTNWKENLIYSLSLDPAFSIFLVEGATWLKKTSTNPNRGFTADNEDVAAGERRTAVQKATKLDLMLGQIANYATIISRNSIVKNSTSLNDIWKKVREHYGFQTTGSRFLDLSNVTLNPDERPEDLYQKLVTFFDDNLLSTDSGLTHHGENVTANEEITPSIENTIVLLWLQRIHSGLPGLVKQRYGAELRNKTLASIKPEISQALDSLLDELRVSEETKVMRSSMSSNRSSYQSRYSNNRTNTKFCCLCRTGNRPGYDTHFLSQCKFLPESDRRRMASKIRYERTIDVDEDDEYGPLTQPCDNSYDDPYFDSPQPVSNQRRVSTKQSPHMNCFYKHIPAVVCLDTGAESNLISADFARRADLNIRPTNHRAVQSDGKTPLQTIGEINNFYLTRGSHSFKCDAIVVKDLGTDIIVGEPFLESNDIGIRSSKKQIIIKGRDVVPYSSPDISSQFSNNRRVETFLCRAPSGSTLFPGEFISVETTGKFAEDDTVVLEPHSSSNMPNWPYIQTTKVISGKVNIANDTNEPIVIQKNAHFCQIRATTDIDLSVNLSSMPVDSIPSKIPPGPFSNTVIVDPNHQLTDEWSDKFRSLHLQYDSVFQPIIGCYNDNSGKVRARVNIGPVTPPTKKIKVPMYSPDMMQLLQDKFDELQMQGVFARPEDVNVVVEHVSPSFLVKKSSGGHRLVTAFASIGQYSKVLPTVMPNIEDTLRSIGAWKYLIVTDLRDSFYQIPLARESLKWCATSTPFKGLRVYTVSAQGMPGSSETLEEMMCAVLGDLIQTGFVSKIADDLYIGGNDLASLYSTWQDVLDRLQHNGLKLKSTKTIVTPTHTTILGWEWNNGTLTAGTHKISPLVTCDPPQTVTSLRSFIGSYKVLNRVLRGCASYINDLEIAISGKGKSERIQWTQPLLDSFHNSQLALKSTKSIHLPSPNDQLIIVHDGSYKGIGSVMYIKCNGQLKLGAFYSAKLKSHHLKWSPCEIEALSIASSVRHFGPYLRQSKHPAQILTDSRPCVQAWGKMQRGEFSCSSRVQTFMATLCEFSVEVQHIKGADNLPSDFLSRNPLNCTSSSCQICKFIDDCENSVVRNVSVEEVLAGRQPMPFTTRPSWRNQQQECADLRRVHAYLSQGTRPTTKMTRLTNVKRYLRKVIISSDGLLVVRHSEPFMPTRELIVVPAHLLHGILTSLHLKFLHPKVNQLKKLFNRSFFALNSDKAIGSIVASCSQCQSLKSIPQELHEQSTLPNPASPCTVFAADIMRRYKQFIFVLRDCFSSFTVTCLPPNEKHDSLRHALVSSVSALRPSPQTMVSIRVDSAPALQKLHNDITLSKLNIFLDFGRIKNVNKNPVAEKAIQELGVEILNYLPEGGPITESDLAIVTSQLNSRLRYRGLSSWEIIHQRNQLTGDQLPFDDYALSQAQSYQRTVDHQHSALHKSRGGPPAAPAPVSIGSLVYIKREKDKTSARNKYIITNIDNDKCTVNKFIKNQMRSRSYTLKLTEVYPITSDLLPIPDVIRGEYESSDEEDSPDRYVEIPIQQDFPNNTEGLSNHTHDNLPMVDNMLIAHRDSNSNIVNDDVSNPVAENVDDDERDVMDSPENNVTDDMPKRQRKQPQWMISGDYKL